ncbi:DNA-binding response regulator [Paracoccus sp. YIM 132242]|uniref:DNA-binding response regulator n=1 Tax=Paracoccus lichenicola TaxID=2665644 RepID=A0A6L6HMZ4_9RHOB|nr:helix-turn-helix transcriptional regulator [Paracoccus lichenicola]MTE00544.1 DNA-binding response regulator [Paracoccus lichenicola]
MDGIGDGIGGKPEAGAAEGRARRFRLWHRDIAQAAHAIGKPEFPLCLETALRQLVSFQMMNGFAYSHDGVASDLCSERVVGTRAMIVDRYLAGSYVLDPFFDALHRFSADTLLVMRRIAPDRFAETEYFRQHYGATGIVDEIGFILKLRHVDAILSLSRMGAERPFSARDVRTLEDAAPLIRFLAERHWADHRKPGAARTVAAASLSNPALTRRENEIVSLILKGHSSLSIAAVLDLSPNTVKVHRRQIYAKLRISSQAELFHLFLG